MQCKYVPKNVDYLNYLNHNYLILILFQNSIQYKLRYSIVMKHGLNLFLMFGLQPSTMDAIFPPILLAGKLDFYHQHRVLSS